MVRSVSRIRYLRTDSARDTALFAFSTALSSDARTSASLLASASVISGLPCAASQPGTPSGSSVMSAPMNGRWSPTTTTWLTSGCARMRSSSTAGATFLPPAVTMISFLRPVIRR